MEKGVSLTSLCSCSSLLRHETELIWFTQLHRIPLDASTAIRVRVYAELHLSSRHDRLNLITRSLGHLLSFIASATSRHVSIIIKTRLALTSYQRLQHRHNFHNCLLEILQASPLRIASSRSTINRYYGYVLGVWTSLIWLISIIDLYKNIHDQIVVIIFFCCIGPSSLLGWGIGQLPC